MQVLISSAKYSWIQYFTLGSSSWSNVNDLKLQSLRTPKHLHTITSELYRTEHWNYIEVVVYQENGTHPSQDVFWESRFAWCCIVCNWLFLWEMTNHLHRLLDTWEFRMGLRLLLYLLLLFEKKITVGV